MNSLKIKPNSKGQHMKSPVNDVFSPLMQYMKDAQKPIIKKNKYSAKRAPGTKTQHYSRGGQSSMGHNYDS